MPPVGPEQHPKNHSQSLDDETFEECHTTQGKTTLPSCGTGGTLATLRLKPIFRHNCMKAKLSLLVASVAALSAPSHAQVAFDGDYSQDFDSLDTSPASPTSTTYTWTDNSTLPGWYSSRETYIAGFGSTTTGGLYSYGAASSNERALGSLATGSATPIGYGVRLQNTSGVTLSEFTVSYTGEQWRNSGNTTQHGLTFWYLLGSGLDGLNLQSDVGWTAFTGLNFDGPIALSGASALDGNAAANQVELSATLSGVSLAPNQELFLRWSDVDNAGSDHGLAIDNFNVSALTVVPEPSTWALLGGGLAFLAYRMRRRK